jgi:hypothetical protein
MPRKPLDTAEHWGKILEKGFDEAHFFIEPLTVILTENWHSEFPIVISEALEFSLKRPRFGLAWCAINLHKSVPKAHFCAQLL